MSWSARFLKRLQSGARHALMWLVLTQVCPLFTEVSWGQFPAFELETSLSEETYDSIRKLTFSLPQNSIDTLRASLQEVPEDAYSLRSQLTSLLGQALWHTQSYHIDTIIKYKRKSVELAGASKDSLLFAESLIQLGSMMRYQSNFAEGERLIFKAVGILQRKGGDEEKSVAGVNALCNLCLAANDFEKAIKYGRRSEKESRRLSTGRQLYAAQLCKVRALQRSLKDEQAIAFADSIFAEHEAGGTRDQMYIATIHAVIRTSNVRLGDTTAAIENQKMVVEAELAQAKTSESYETYYGALARLAIYEERYADALKNLEIYYPYLKKNFPNARLERTGEEYALSLKEVGRVAEAYEAEKELRNRLEQIHRKELAAAQQDLRQAYLAKEQEAQLAASFTALDKQKTTTRWIIGLASALLISLSAVGLGFRRSRKQAQVLASRSEENERLLKEVHHRVKNNLEIVSSLLELQADKLTDPEASKAIQAGRSRILSIGLLHQKLYQDRAVGSVEMAGYLRDLVELLMQTYGSEKQVDLDLQLDAITFELEQALPLGLIVNELVTNAMKYAFTADRVGQLQVGFQEPTPGAYKVWVADNGAGKAEGAALSGTGFGSELIRLLTIQLAGKVVETNKGGLKVEVSF